MAKEMWTYAMEKMSYPDVQEVLKTTDVVLIPIGSQEKHGPHIPLATDSIATIETTMRAAQKAKVPHTPLIPVGYSPHHMGELSQGIIDILEEKIAWHSGEMETAQCLAHDESSVHMDRAEAQKAHAPEWLGPEFAKTDGVPTVIFQGSENIFIPMEHHEYAQDATIGDPHLGTKEKGEQIFEKASDNLADFVKEVQKIKVEIKERNYDFRAW
jgi:creatinine amidohydrolase/Fe(II)-dependent formamide hydrolase-like protein